MLLGGEQGRQLVADLRRALLQFLRLGVDPLLDLVGIAGEDALLINPEDDESISKMMLKIENDESLYNQQREYGLERAKMFSWKKTAENLLKVYNSVLKQA